MRFADTQIIDIVAIERAARAEQARALGAMLRAAGQWLAARLGAAVQTRRPV